MDVTKSEWTKPELTVLTRNRREEAVLTFCKLGATQGPGAQCNSSQPAGCYVNAAS